MPKQASLTAGSAAARRLLVQAFAGAHPINSGVIGLELKLVANGSSAITEPIELSFGGPFMNRGAGRVPASDFTIAIGAQGHHADLQLIAAGGSGYIKVSGETYRIPAASFKRLESDFGGLVPAPSATRSGAGALTTLGIEPLHWLVDPRIVGSASIGGVKTTRIRAGVDVSALLRDLERLAGKSGLAGRSGLGGNGQSGIAHALGSPSVNIWTGAADGMSRKLSLTATIPVSGQTRQLLGGTRSVTLTLDLAYSHLNQPQTIRAPAVTKPFSAFRALVTQVLRGLGGNLAGVPRAGQRYTHCITAAAGNVAKMQKCSRVLGSG